MALNGLLLLVQTENELIGYFKMDDGQWACKGLVTMNHGLNDAEWAVLQISYFPLECPTAMMLSAKELNKGKGMENGNIAIYLDILPLHNLLVQ